jgi:hypothetical protein
VRKGGAHDGGWRAETVRTFLRREPVEGWEERLKLDDYRYFMTMVRRSHRGAEPRVAERSRDESYDGERVFESFFESLELGC